MLRQTSRPATETGYFVPLLALPRRALALRIAAIHFAKIDLVLDEAQYWTWSRELAFGYFSKPPMIAWVIRGSTKICGNRRGLHPLGLSGPSTRSPPSSCS